MAHHKSSLKRIRQESKRRIQNRYYKKSTRTLIKKLRDLTDKFSADDRVITSKISSRDDIYKSIKEFLGKGK